MTWFEWGAFGVMFSWVCFSTWRQSQFQEHVLERVWEIEARVGWLEDQVGSDDD